MAVEVRATPLANKIVEKLPRRARRAYDQFEADLAARGCAALAYRLSGDLLGHLCVVHLIGAMRGRCRLRVRRDSVRGLSTYGAEYRGIVQYYLLAGDVWRLNRLRWAAETSLLKTLAAKHRSTVPKMAARYGAVIATPHGPRRCFQASIDRGEGRKPLVARFGGIPLKRQRKAVLTDRQPTPAHPRKELIRRLLADRCELCGHAGPTEVHQVRKLADLAKPGQPQPGWAELMAKRRRKTLPVCQACHDTIHTGQPAATSTQKSPESHVR